MARRRPPGTPIIVRFDMRRFTGRTLPAAPKPNRRCRLRRAVGIRQPLRYSWTAAPRRFRLDDFTARLGSLAIQSSLLRAPPPAAPDSSDSAELPHRIDSSRAASAMIRGGS